jgi:hypothetical protein
MKTWCWTSFYPRTQTCTCSLESYIEGLDFAELTQNVTQLWVTFSSPKMWWTNLHIQALTWAFRYCLRTGSWQFGSGSVIIWAALSYNRRPNIMRVQWNLTAQRYRYDILQPDMAQCFWPTEGDVSVGQCTAPYSKCNHRTQNNVNVLPWPSRSLDLNTIEHLWDSLDRRVCQRQHPPQALETLGQTLQHE